MYTPRPTPLQVPFWPQGLGINRGGVAVYDVMWAMLSLEQQEGKMNRENAQAVLSLKDDLFLNQQSVIEAAIANSIIPTGLGVTPSDKKKKMTMDTYTYEVALGPGSFMRERFDIPKVTNPNPSEHYVKYNGAPGKLPAMDPLVVSPGKFISPSDSK